MITAEKAFDLIMELHGYWGAEKVPFYETNNRILVENIYAKGSMVMPQNVDHCPAGSEFEYIAFRDVGL